MQITWGHKHIKMFSIQCLTNVVDNLPQQNKKQIFSKFVKILFKTTKNYSWGKTGFIFYTLIWDDTLNRYN